MFGKIISIERDSLAEDIDLKPGDSIIEMLIEHADGNRELIEFEKDIDIKFESNA